MLNKISIKFKLIALLLSAIIGFILLISLMYYSTWNSYELGEIDTKIEELNSDMLMLRRNEKDFILRKDLIYKKKFEKNVSILIAHSKELEYELKKHSLHSNNIVNFQKIVKSYEKSFFNFINLQQRIGLNSKDGLYGSLRKSVHQVQDFAKKSNDYLLLSKVYDLRKQEKDFMLRRDLKYVSKYINKIDKLLKNVEDEKMLSNLLSYKKDFLLLVKAEQDIGLTSKLGLQGKMRKTIHKTETLLKSMIKTTNIIIKEKINTIISLSLIFSLILILILTVFVLLINKNITKSINTFQVGFISFFKYLNKESNTITLLENKSNDEIGQMSDILNKNIEKTRNIIEEDQILLDDVKKVVSLVNQGNIKQKILATSSNKSLEELKTIINQMLETISSNICEDLNKLEDALMNYQELDFSKRIENTNGKTALGLNALADIISSMLSQNQETGITLQSSSNSLLKNVNNLSKSSNEAAASLEETSASLDEITSNIVKNTQNVEKMISKANELNNSAQDGKKLANETTIAMDNINEQVNSINEAITVIDQIAFQTNILSLNAAVEAATAGEAGKGFAVVAQEVRNLASRSAEAAKEIKELVENATLKANNGKEISDKMIQGYVDLNKNIETTTTLMNDVQKASKEQQEGINQINNAINQLDHQTQENAVIANTTNEIALRTQNIADEIVKNTNEKKFS